jgi:signal transduction histidine kinase
MTIPVLGWRPRGLRSGVTLAFALGALALSSTLALGTYFSVRHVLVEQRERTAMRQAYADAALFRDGLLTSGTQVSDVLGSISPPAGAAIYVHRAGLWYSSSLDHPGDELTASVRPAVESGSVATAWTNQTNPHAIVVGIPLPAVDADYYEVSVAEELASTLRTLAIALTICAAFTTLAGALLGRAASRRVLAPLGDVTSAAVKVSAGDMEARLGETQDPDLVALVGAFNHMIDALHERIQQDARFAADVSHELRTPVTTLTTSLSLLQRAEDLTPQATSAVQLMTDELARFRRALEDLLTLGRLDARADGVDLSLTRAPELARQALIASARSVDLLARPAESGPIPLVNVDRRQLVRALINLFDNADLHAGGLTSVWIAEMPGYVDIHVEDQGPGVPYDDIDRIFERFARAGGAKAGTGSGLGLSIVAQTALNHGGMVWCANQSGRGADFVLRLPTVDDETVGA